MTSIRDKVMMWKSETGNPEFSECKSAKVAKPAKPQENQWVGLLKFPLEPAKVGAGGGLALATPSSDFSSENPQKTCTLAGLATLAGKHGENRETDSPIAHADLRELFLERAALIENGNSGMDREKADALAMIEVAALWQTMHPPIEPPTGCCVACHQPIDDKIEAAEIWISEPPRAWRAHAVCAGRHYEARRREACESVREAVRTAGWD